MCTATSEVGGGRRCLGCVRRGIGARLTGATERVEARLEQLAAMTETAPAEESPGRRRRHFRDLVAQAFGALAKKRDARTELRALELAGADVQAVALVETAEDRLRAVEDRVVIEEAALAMDGASLFGRKAELMRALVPIEAERDAAEARLRATRERLKPVDDQPGERGFPTERRQAVNNAVRDLERLNVRAKLLTASWSSTPTIAEQEQRVAEARAELAAATTAYEASLESAGTSVVPAAA